MDERAINGAAIEAIRDLELDCEIKDVSQPAGRDEWCIQFSDKYGQFCDGFKNQFEEENSHQVIREKIKSHLIKQVNKIRGSTGRKRKPAVDAMNEGQETESGILAAPLRMIGEVFGRASGIAGIVIDQASTLAEAARDTVSEAAANISPVTIEVRSKTKRTRQKRVPAGSTPKKTIKATKTASTKAKKANKRATHGSSKQAKKAGQASRRTRKAVRKTAKKSLKRAK